MGKKILAMVVLVMVAFGGAVGGPVLGPKRVSDFRVPASQTPGVPGENDYAVECRGNEKTSVMVMGDHRPVVDLELLVFEVLGNGEDKLVARDVGTKDIVGVVFTPPRTGMYRIVVRNPSTFQKDINPYNGCYLSIR